MYKIILKYSPNKGENINTIVLDYFNKDPCRTTNKSSKRYIYIYIYIYTSFGVTILELKLFKTEQINVSEQI